MSAPSVSAEEFIREGEYLWAAMQRTGSIVATRWPSVLDEIELARQLVGAVIGSVFARLDKEVPKEAAGQKLRRANIHAAVIQGVHPIEFCLAIGAYAQAGCLIRQEFEAVEVLKGYREGNQKDKGSPNITLKHLGRVYGQLSGLAHYTSADFLLEALSGGLGDHQHHLNEELVRFLTMVHIHSLAAIVLDVAELRPFSPSENLSSDENYYVSAVMGILVKRGFLKLEGGQE